MVGAIIGAVGGVVSSWLSNRKEKAQARHERDIAIIKGKQKLAEGEQSHNSAIELECLKKAHPFFRWTVGFTILSPIWITMYDQPWGQRIFTVLADTVPAEWWGLFVVMCMFVFGNRNIVEIVKNFKLFK